MMLLKCRTQHVSKFGKLNSGCRTGRGQFSFQSQRKAMPKNVQTMAQLHASHTLVKWCSKFSKPGFSNTWTMNFQMFKLDLQEAEEQEVKLSTSSGSLKKHETSRKTSTSALLTIPKPLTVWITTNWCCINTHSLNIYQQSYGKQKGIMMLIFFLLYFTKDSTEALLFFLSLYFFQESLSSLNCLISKV